MGLFLLEFLLPDCKVLWCLAETWKAESITSCTEVLKKGCDFMVVFVLWFFSKLVRTGELHGTWHVREEATVFVLYFLCAQ